MLNFIQKQNQNQKQLFYFIKIYRMNIKKKTNKQIWLKIKVSTFLFFNNTLSSTVEIFFNFT